MSAEQKFKNKKKFKKIKVIHQNQNNNNNKKSEIIKRKMSNNKYNRMTSLLSLALLISCAQADSNLRGHEQASNVLSYAYMISSQDNGQDVQIQAFWTNTFIEIGGIKVQAALGKDGLFVSRKLAHQIPLDGTLKLGANEFSFDTTIQEYEDCGRQGETFSSNLMLEGHKNTWFSSKPDTWFKDEYSCFYTSAYDEINRDIVQQLCAPTFGFAEDFTCTRALTNLTDHTLIPIWNEASCTFASPCFVNNRLVKLLDSKEIEQCYGTVYNRNKKCNTAAPTKAPTAAPTAAPTVAPTKAPTTAPTVAPTKAPTFFTQDCGVPQNAQSIPEYPFGGVGAVGLASAAQSTMNGVQLHLVPFNPSSCPIKESVTVFGKTTVNSELVTFPQGCEGYVYTTLIENLQCGKVADYKLKYQPDGHYAVRVTSDGAYYFEQIKQ